jgi:hypothetical protein
VPSPAFDLLFAFSGCGSDGTGLDDSLYPKKAFYRRDAG